MRELNFIKMHGLGNDFILLKQDDLLAIDSKYSDVDSVKEFAQTIANRHTGLGCDQLIIYHPQDHSNWLMSIYNHDGSEAKACGNATRCLAYLAAKQHGVSTLRIHVAGRKLNCKIEDNGFITVNMGSISFDENWMPEASKLWELASFYKLELKEILCADAGNPHLIIFNDNLSNEDMKLLGQKIEQNNLFPDGVNVNFVKIHENNLQLKVWERGTGFTLACGSGACASFAAAHKLGFIGNHCDIIFTLGSLHMQTHSENILMTGPATLVSQGVLYV